MNIERYRNWFYAAAIYNFIWGTINVLFPSAYFNLINMEQPKYLALWQVVGMFVLAYAPAYYWSGKNPEKHYHFILIGFLGKLLGPIGFVFSLITNALPLAFGLTLITNDLIWWPIFILYIRDIIREKGIKNVLNGE